MRIERADPYSDAVLDDYIQDIVNIAKFKQARYLKILRTSKAMNLKQSWKMHDDLGEAIYEDIHRISINLSFKKLIPMLKRMTGKAFQAKDGKELPEVDKMVKFIQQIITRLQYEPTCKAILNDRFGPNAIIYIRSRYADQKIAFEIKGIEQQIIRDKNNVRKDKRILELKQALTQDWGLNEFNDFELIRLAWGNSEDPERRISRTIRLWLSEWHLENNLAIVAAHDKEWQRLSIRIGAAEWYADEHIYEKYRRDRLQEKRQFMRKSKNPDELDSDYICVWINDPIYGGIQKAILPEQFDAATMCRSEQPPSALLGGKYEKKSNLSNYQNQAHKPRFKGINEEDFENDLDFGEEDFAQNFMLNEVRELQECEDNDSQFNDSIRSSAKGVEDMQDDDGYTYSKVDVISHNQDPLQQQQRAGNLQQQQQQFMQQQQQQQQHYMQQQQYQMQQQQQAQYGPQSQYGPPQPQSHPAHRRSQSVPPQNAQRSGWTTTNILMPPPEALGRGGNMNNSNRNNQT